jgi:hypothetical protein
MKYVPTFEQFINERYDLLNESVDPNKMFNPKRLDVIIELTQVEVNKFLNKNGYSIFVGSGNDKEPFNIGITKYKGNTIALFYKNRKGEIVRASYSLISNTVGFDIRKLEEFDETTGNYKVGSSLLPVNNNGFTAITTWPAKKETFQFISDKIISGLS